MHKYRLLGKKGEGTFSEVLRAQSVKTGAAVAIKCMKQTYETIDQVNSLREIQALRRLSPHPHIVKLYEVLYDQPTGRLALVFELMDCNIYELTKGRKHFLPEHLVKSYMYQLIKAVDHMHKHGIFHRDIKPENLLIADNLLKLADFGSCRGTHSRKPYTEYISTRWYRAPECLLTDGYYSQEMDIWGVGCVIFEALSLKPLFPGSNESDQIERIHKILGTPDAALMAKFKRYGSTHVDWSMTHWPGKPDIISKQLEHCSPEALDIVMKMLIYDPERRLTAKEAVKHPWFADLRAAENPDAPPPSDDKGVPYPRAQLAELPPLLETAPQKAGDDKHDKVASPGTKISGVKSPKSQVDGTKSAIISQKAGSETGGKAAGIGSPPPVGPVATEYGKEKNQHGPSSVAPKACLGAAGTASAMRYLPPAGSVISPGGLLSPLRPPAGAVLPGTSATKPSAVKALNEIKGAISLESQGNHAVSLLAAAGTTKTSALTLTKSPTAAQTAVANLAETPKRSESKTLGNGTLAWHPKTVFSPLITSNLSHKDVFQRDTVPHSVVQQSGKVRLSPIAASHMPHKEPSILPTTHSVSKPYNHLPPIIKAPVPASAVTSQQSLSPKNPYIRPADFKPVVPPHHPATSLAKPITKPLGLPMSESTTDSSARSMVSKPVQEYTPHLAGINPHAFQTRRPVPFKGNGYLEHLRKRQEQYVSPYAQRGTQAG